MSSEIKKLVKHSAVYSIGTLLSKIIGFLMIPVYTRFLMPEDYGIIELLALTTDVIGMVLAVGIGDAIYRFYFDSEDDEVRKQIVSTALLTFGVIGFTGLLLISTFSNPLSLLIIGSEKYSSYFLITFTTLWFNTLFEIGSTYLIIKQKPFIFISFSIGRLIVALSLNILFVVYYNMKVLGIVLSSLFTAIVGAVALLSIIIPQIGLSFSYKECKKMLVYGLPLIPSRLASFVVNVSDRYFLNYFSSLSDVGIYSLGYKFGLIGHYFVTSPFFQAWAPRRFEIFKQENAREVFSKVLTYFILISTFFGLVIALFSKDAIELVATPAFYDAYKVVPIIVLCYLILSLQYHFEIGILIHKKTKLIMYINLTVGILNLLLNFILIKRFHIWGAALATLFCMLFKVALTYKVSSKLYPIPFEFDRVAKIFITAFVLYLTGTFITTGYFLSSALLKSIILLGFPLLLYLMDFFTYKEKTYCKDMIKTYVPALNRRNF